jgi:outer membrane protein assembly factor BamE (lipoprotein component of BamABCDE complex)
MKRIAILIGALALAGCASVAPRPTSIHTGDGEGQVRAKLGAPAMERKLATGATAWYYATGPSGFFTWRVVFSPAGAVTDYTQVLTAKNFSALGQGATREAVLDQFGPPMERMSFPRTATEAWTYRWMDGTLEMIADAVFDATGGLKHVALYRDPAFSSAVDK